MASPTILQEALRLQPQIVEWRRRFHSYPELSYEEHNTSSLLAELLTQKGFQITRGIAGTGLVGDLGAGKRTIAVRAEMDALPITECNDLPFRSTNTGVMHACGHDAHLACAIAAATILSHRKLPGRLRMIMQPAEETCDNAGLTGANRMVEEHVMDGVDAILGLHVSSSIPTGKVSIATGPVFASCDDFRITITAEHRVSPDRRQPNLVVIAASLIQSLQQVVSRRTSPADPVVLTIGAMHTLDDSHCSSGAALAMDGSFRTFNESMRNRVWEDIQRLNAIAAAVGAKCEFTRQSGYPATVNDAGIAQTMRETACEMLGEDNVLALAPRMAAEDFSFFAKVAPAAFMLVGVEIAGDRRNHHSATFDLDESHLYVGAAVLAETALRLMD